MELLEIQIEIIGGPQDGGSIKIKVDDLDKGLRIVPIEELKKAYPSVYTVEYKIDRWVAKFKNSVSEKLK